MIHSAFPRLSGWPRDINNSVSTAYQHSSRPSMARISSTVRAQWPVSNVSRNSAIKSPRSRSLLSTGLLRLRSSTFSCTTFRSTSGNGCLDSRGRRYRGRSGVSAFICNLMSSEAVLTGIVAGSAERIVDLSGLAITIRE